MNVYITIQRESEEVYGWVSGPGKGQQWGVTNLRARYFLKFTPKRRKAVDYIGQHLWEALGLPDEDGEHRLLVEYDATSLTDPSWTERRAVTTTIQLA